jgi:heterotetrameric sarcosine oxidase gamma subunit
MQDPSVSLQRGTRQGLALRLAGTASGNPAAPGALRLAVLEPLRVVAVRALPAADGGWIEALRDSGVTRLPAPGRCEGDAVRVVWRSPTEYWLVTERPALLDPVAEALRPGATALAYAVDHSTGTVGIELQGEELDGVLARLMDAAAIAALPGQATRARCADLAVVLLRLQAQRAWLLVERPVADYLLDWLRLACDRVGAG